MTGNINAKIWDNVSELNSKFGKGDAVAISGYVESYIENLQLIVRKLIKQLFNIMVDMVSIQ